MSFILSHLIVLTNSWGRSYIPLHRWGNQGEGTCPSYLHSQVRLKPDYKAHILSHSSAVLKHYYWG